MRHLKRSRGILLACLLIAVVALTAVFTLNTFASEVTTEFTNVAMTLNDGTNIRLIGTLAEADRDSAVVEYTLSEETKTAEVTVDDNGNFTADIPVGAAQMNETISVSLLCGGEVKDTTTQSIRDYAAQQLANDNTAVKLVVSEMLRYGEEAYKYTNEGASSSLLDGLVLSEALTFPASPVYTYTKDATSTFTKIQLTLTDALRLTLKNAAGDVAVKETVKISQFFEGITATAGEASVTASASLYANMKQGDAEVGALVKALYNYATAVHIALDSHVYTSEAIIDTTASTIAYACPVCGDTVSNAYLALDEFTGAYAGNCGVWFDNGADVDYTTNKSVLQPVTVGTSATGTPFYAVHTAKTGAQTNDYSLVMGFETTVPEGGFGTNGWLIQAKCEAGANMQTKLIEFKETSVYVNQTKVCDVDAGETHNFAIKVSFTQDGTNIDGHYTIYMDGNEVGDFHRTTAATFAGNKGFSSKQTQFQIYTGKVAYNNASVSWIVDNVYVANQLPSRVTQ